MKRSCAVAGRFYPSDPQGCRRAVSGLVADIEPGLAVGCIAPHAGWMYSGRAAARGLASILGNKPETIVIFGAVHVDDRHAASLFPTGTWETPLQDLEVDAGLAGRLPGACRHIATAPEAHRLEHSIEVLLPLLAGLCDGRAAPLPRLVPIMVRPGPFAADIGRAVAVAAGDLGRRVAFVASTDLTHYGPAFRFEPAGRGEAGLRWAKTVNDRRFVDTLRAMDPGAVVPEAAVHHNACGAGAVAATLAAVGEFGAGDFQELLHTSSAEVDGGFDSGAVNSVGYLAAAFGR